MNHIALTVLSPNLEIKKKSPNSAFLNSSMLITVAIRVIVRIKKVKSLKTILRFL